MAIAELNAFLRLLKQSSVPKWSILSFWGDGGGSHGTIFGDVFRYICLCMCCLGGHFVYMVVPVPLFHRLSGSHLDWSISFGTFHLI